MDLRKSIHSRSHVDRHSYASFVAARVQRSPCLASLHNFLRESPMSYGCRIVCLEFFNSFAAPIQRDLTPNDLTLLLANEDQENPDLRGRILIVEDLTKEIIEILGSSLNVDPFFFASHIDAFLPEVATPKPYMAALPSVIGLHNFINLHYLRLLNLESTQERTLQQHMNVPRRVRVLPPLEGAHIGLARHCSSILKTATKDGLWLGRRREIPHD